MSDVVVGHSEDGDLGDGPSSALNPTGPLVDGGQIRVHVTGETTPSGNLRISVAGQSSMCAYISYILIADKTVQKSDCLLISKFRKIRHFSKSLRRMDPV